MTPTEELQAELEEVGRQIDLVREEQSAHTRKCTAYGKRCKACERLQERLNKLYEQYADLLLMDESPRGESRPLPG